MSLSDYTWKQVFNSLRLACNAYGLDEVLQLPAPFLGVPLVGYCKGEYCCELPVPKRLMLEGKVAIVHYYREELEQVAWWFGTEEAPVWC